MQKDNGQKDSNQKTIIIATISFVVGFALAWFIAVQKGYVPNSAQDGANLEPTMSAENSIAVEDQNEGVRIILDSVTLKESGWAVIHEDSDGTPGRILGAQLFDPGTTEPSVVDLLRGTLAGNTYYAMLHSDNGDRSFIPKQDPPLLDGEGNPIMMRFQATASTDIGQ